ncbi:hypothetical protein SAMN05660866_01515 [Maribacter arcticus]|uniref:Uncharacterized protein n=2 Tax=Maribacter arcticus TaxID=561365 RepID=A0A1T5BC30_9FLAO|nr:hypothetical protein SAMN05660866_01515 [Maribacter arcticus]
MILGYKSCFVYVAVILKLYFNGMKRVIIKDIVEKVFDKAKSECAGDSKNALCNHISKSIDLSSKTLERLYDKYFDEKSNVGKQSEHTINMLCQYLNFGSYADYVQKNGGERIEIVRKKNRILLSSIGLVLLAGSILFFVYNKDGEEKLLKNGECMVWIQNHFEKVDCAVSYKGKVVPLDPLRLTNFEKTPVGLTTDFFDEVTNEPLIWYFKKGNDEIEYFTAPGLHPINGSTLKAITPYIIDKYVPKHIYNENSFVQP